MIGKPVSHSLSPEIHAMFAAQTGLPVEYGMMEPDGDDFESLAKGFLREGGKGLNVTLPYKGRAFGIADHSSGVARLARASNTLRAEEDGTISSCSTDGAGLVRDICRRHEVVMKDSRVLVIGAGGSASSITSALVDQCPDLLCVANRTLSRARDLVSLITPVGKQKDVSLLATDLDGILEAGPFDIVIHTTSAGHGDGSIGLDGKAVEGASFAYDLSYGEAAKPFLALCASQGIAKRSNGLGMLVEQAALSFAYWEGVMPLTDPVFEELSGR